MTATNIGDHEDRYRRLVESVEDYAIVMLDANGVVATWNSGAERLYGYPASEILGQHVSRFYPVEEALRCQREIDTATASRRVESEAWLARKDGSRFLANVTITCMRDVDDKVVGFAKVARDVTERRRADATLRESEERFRLLVESVKDYAIFRLDSSGHVATWNADAERIKGYRPQEILGRHFSAFYPAEEIRAGKCEMELEAAARLGRFEDEGWRVRKDGTRFWASVVITALRDPTGALLGFAKVTRDLTERHEAERDRLRIGHVARERVSVLSRLAEDLSAALTLEEVGETVTRIGTELAHADITTLYSLDDKTKVLTLVAQQGCNPGLLHQILEIAPGSNNPAYQIGIGAAPAVWVETLDEYDAFFPALSRVTLDGQRAVAFWGVPLIAEGRAIGLLGAGFHTPRAFAQDEKDFVRTFARLCAQALLRATRVTKEREAAALADRLRATLLTTLRSIGDAVIATDATGSITLMNEVAQSLTGWAEEDARGHTLPEVFRIINEHSRAPVQNPVEKVLESGAIVGLANHTLLVARDGREIPIDDSGAPIRGESGQIEGVVLVFRDVTERKREEVMQAFLSDATSILATSLDHELTVARVAELAVPRLADWCAVDLAVEGEALPKRLAVAHIDPEKVALAKELHLRYPSRSDAPTGVPNVLRTGQAEFYPLISDEILIASCVDSEHLRVARALQLRSAIIVPLVARSRVLGALTFVFAESGRVYTEDHLRLAQDLARRCAVAIENAQLYASEQNARRNADVANQAKDEFLAMVSHELRTPLNAILGWSKLLRTGDLDPRRRAGGLETVERNAVAMAELIDDLLDMSRMIGGQLRLDVQAVDLREIVETSVRSAEPAAMAKGIALRSDLPAASAVILGDPNRLQQIVWNMLSNAVKFTARGGRVVVKMRDNEGAVEVEVSDTGKGVEPSFLPRVFEAFRQEDASPSRGRGGLGLGLAITRQLVELHGGHIVAHSDGPGRGATFKVSFPRATLAGIAAWELRKRRRAEASDGANRREERSPLHGLRALVVDDDEDARALLALILEGCGCSVSSASGVAEAMTLITESPPDVLLSDVAMPDEDGYAFIRKVRALPREKGGDMLAAAVTAYARPEDRRALLHAGFSMHLAKPVDPEALVAVVTALSRARPR